MNPQANNFFNLELPKGDLEQLENGLRARLRALTDAQRKAYYDRTKPRLRDPDTYAVLCWTFGLGLHHLYLSKIRSFFLDLLTGVCIYGSVLAWVFTSNWFFPVLLILSLLYSFFDLVFSLVLSQRVVQRYNISTGYQSLIALKYLNPSEQVDTHGLPVKYLTRDKNASSSDRKFFLLILSGIAVLVVLVWLFFTFAVPAIAKYIAFNLPETTFMVASRAEAVTSIDALEIFSPTETTPEVKNRLQSLFDSIGRRKDGALPYHLLIREGGALGANAVAFPSGIIVVTQALIELAENDHELLGVLAHEFGHLEYRHGVRTFLQDSANLLVMLVTTGDFVSVAGAGAAMMQMVMHAQYSQEFEREADRFAIEHFKAKGIPVENFAKMLTRLAKDNHDEASGRWQSFVASHPPTPERIRLLQP